MSNKLKYTTVKSGFEKLDGKYVGQFVSNGTDGLDEIAEAICAAHPTIGEAEVRLAVRALAAEIRKAVADDLTYVTTGTVAGFAPAISGSVDAMDAALVEGVNEFYVNIVPLDYLRAVIGALVPSQANPGDIAVRIDAVEDAGTETRGVIVGTDEFVVTGKNLSASQEGEGLELVKDDDTVVSTATITEADGMGQRITAKLTSSVDRGSYRLMLKSRGYATPEGTLETYVKRVSVM